MPISSSPISSVPISGLESIGGGTTVTCGIASASVVGLSASVVNGIAVQCGLAIATAVGLNATVDTAAGSGVTVNCGLAVAIAVGLHASIPTTVAEEGDTSLKVYDLGDVVRVRTIFFDGSNQPVDPTVVNFRVRPPSEVEVTYTYNTDDEVVREEAGVYHILVVADEVGEWYGQWDCAGEAQGAQPALWMVRGSGF